MFENVARPWKTAVRMVAKSSSSSTRSDASRATSVPLRPMAMPMSASCSAGPSLTPSPVMATTWPLACSARAIRSLSSGDTRAITAPSRSTIAPRTWSSSGRSVPTSTGESSRSSPISAAMARAVAGWSPVTMATAIPAWRQASSEARTSGRGGSSMPSRATRVRPSSASRAVSGGAPA